MSEQEDEVVETFHHWFQQNYPLYERDGRDTTIKRKMEQAWNSAQKASADTIAAAEAKCERVEAAAQPQPCCGEYAICTRACTPRGKWLGERAAEAKCVELEKALRELLSRISNHSCYVGRKVGLEDAMEQASAALPQPSDTQRDR